MVNTFSPQNIEQFLIDKKNELEVRLKKIEYDDPIMDNSIAESSELGTDAWIADVHAQSEVVKGTLLNLLAKIKHALKKVQEGTYGKCEKCGKAIEEERLKAFPTAAACTLCLAITKNL